MIFFINLFIFFLGAAVGSFLNVLIDRLPQEKSINGRSVCDHCQRQLSWIELIPIFSFLFLKGKSRCCRKKLSLQYPLVETLTAVIFLLIYNLDFSFLKILVLWGVFSCLIVIFFSDVKYQLISDYILFSFFFFSLFFHIFNRVKVDQFKDYFFSGLIVALPIFFIYYLSKEKAMGLGDVYLTAIIGFFFGWQKGFLALYLAFLLGGLISIFLIILKKKKIKSKIAFGPFLVISTAIMFFWGDQIVELIRKIYNI